jgi:hypothetical protein
LAQPLSLLRDRVVQRDDPLCVECTWAQEANGNGDLVSSASKTCGMRYHGDERAIVIGARGAKNQTRSDLRGQAEVREPDLASACGFHP